MIEKNEILKSAVEEIQSMEIQENAESKFSGEHREASSRSVMENYERMSIIGMTKSQMDVYKHESSIKIKDIELRTQKLLQKFRNSHYFVRIAESNEPLWSKRHVSEPKTISGGHSSSSTFVDTGNSDGSVSGVARNSVTCCSLRNGDIVVCFYFLLL